MKKIKWIILIIAVFMIMAMLPGISAPPPASLNNYRADPPFLSSNVPPLVMFVMARDHKLFYKAYNDVSDLDDPPDGIIDSTYKDSLDYYGYFDPNKCYVYSGGRFDPSALATGANSHFCSAKWSGNFLNWATMARIDVVRKVLYGGYRTSDSSTLTVLTRTTLPWDAHSWAKVYNGSDIGSLIPFSWSSITLCNTNTSKPNATDPGLVMIKNGFYPYAASTEGKQCTKTFQGGANLTPDYTYNVVVKVCDSAIGLETNCQEYKTGVSASKYKPNGLMQNFGVSTKGTPDTSDDSITMYFGLITGSYGGNVSGGVLRSNIADVTSNEVDNATGIIKGSAKIIKNIDNFRIIEYNYSTGWYDYGGSEGICVKSGGSWASPANIVDGECKSWGNPIGEMLYETIRYYQGKKAPTSQFDKSDPGLSNLTKEAQWDDPYETFSYCAKPFALILSDVFPSYDSDQLPDSYWYSAISTSDTPSVQTLMTNANINALESIGNVFIGESAGTYDKNCTSKSGDFRSIRGLCVEEPTKFGAYYIAGLAHYAKTTDLHPAGAGTIGKDDQKMTTYAVGTASPIPNLKFTVGINEVTLIPIFYDSTDTSKGELVDFQLCQNDADWTGEQALGYTSCFNILWDDAEYGWDYDLDISYRIYVQTTATTITVKTRGLYAAAGNTDYAGYLISGVSGAGGFYDIKCGGTAGFSDCDRYDGNETAEYVRSFTANGATTGFLQSPLWYAAKYGGFKDSDNDANPPTPNLTIEWDEDVSGTTGYGDPDTYFYASNPLTLEAQLTAALAGISKKVSSGTGASILATTSEGEGATYQAFFLPTKIDIVTGIELNWQGYLHSILMDSEGNLREDTNFNQTLDVCVNNCCNLAIPNCPSPPDDLVLKMRYVSGSGTFIDLYSDNNGNELADDCVDLTTASGKNFCPATSGIPIENIYYPPYQTVNTWRPLWNAGYQLWERTASTRVIYTSITGTAIYDYTPGAYDSTDSFVDTNKTALRKYLRANTDTEAGYIINYIRGVDRAGYRPRNMYVGNTTNNIWKLGDIIYSTPTLISKPAENYDLIYADSTYNTFFKKWAKRRQVVYVGANDGMLHAFNAGCYDEINHKFFPDVDGSGNCIPGSHTLGEELWSFIPRDLLPHLQWLTLKNYSHVYYVDLKPKVTDAQIFTCDTDHVGANPVTGKCWGTILIGGMRLGGKSISTESGIGTFSPSYFALDITNPEIPPKLLWTFKDTNLGQGTSYPAVARILTRDSFGNITDDDWFMVVGSGPTGYDIYSNVSSSQYGYVFIADLNTGTLLRSIQTPDNKALMADPITIDVGLDYKVDVSYIGETYLSGTKWEGKMLRLTTANDSNPSNWTLSTLIDLSDSSATINKPIFSAPSAALDNRGNLWVFFGTGQFWGIADKANTDDQSFYGIKDSCKPWSSGSYACTNTMSSFLDVSNATVAVGGGTVTGVTGVTDWSTLLGAINAKDGWVIDFKTVPGHTSYIGERALTKPLVLGGVVAFTTYIPNTTDPCLAEGDAYVYAPFYETGTAYKNYVFTDELINKPSTVGRDKWLGKGMPSSLSGTITRSGKLKGFSQQATGAIIAIEQLTPFKITSGIAGWRSQCQ
jgi:type IV pilus assembly protein PilY1